MKMKSYYQKEIETASREEILKIQNEKIVKQVNTSMTTSPTTVISWIRRV